MPYYSAKKFVNSLQKPRRILLIVKAGEGTDKTIESFKPFLERGDILIDSGNTFYKDSSRWNRELSAEGFNFIGTGVSGSEKGALKGPSIMPGGRKHAIELIAPNPRKITARVDGDASVTYIGHDNAGYYVKMVHNCIEYGDISWLLDPIRY